MFKNANGQVRAGWLIALALLLMFIGQIIFSIPGTFFLILKDAVVEDGGISFEVDGTREWIFLLTNGAGTVGGLFAVLLVWRLINKEKFTRMGLRWQATDLIFGLVLGALSITIIFIFLYATGQITLVNALSAPEFSMFTLLFFIMFIFVGLFEEIFFRGYIISTMASRHNKRWFIYVASALIFSIVHGTNPNVTLLGLVNIALVGLLFAFMFDVTKSLWLPIGYHITWNFFQGNVFGFAVSGLPSDSIYSIEQQTDSTLWTGGSFGLEGGLLATIVIAISFFITYIYGKQKALKDNPTFW
ncbi:MAG TPA: CPBP family intramembrane glutamic endopeptidase [Pseudogracilibacillus sp.]|nr:CPBP family intramembrane glutamic endopeptidase [Pseudogracilibacillus sp.]